MPQHNTRSPAADPPLRRALGIAARAAAALLGGYALAALGAVAVALALPPIFAAEPADAVLAGMLLSFAAMAGAALWAFAAGSAARAWGGIVAVAVPLALLALAASGSVAPAARGSVAPVASGLAGAGP